MRTDREKFSTLRKSFVTSVTVANTGSMQGEVNLKSSANKNILLTNVSYAPDSATNVISVSYIDKKGGYVTFKNST